MDHGQGLACSKFLGFFLMQVFVERPVHHFTLGPPWPCSTVEQTKAVLPCVLWVLGRLPTFFLTLTSPRLTAVCTESKDTEFSQRKWNVFGAPSQPDQTFSSRVQSKVCGLSAAWSPNFPLGTFFNFCHVLWVCFFFYGGKGAQHTAAKRERTQMDKTLTYQENISSSVDNVSTTKKRKWNANTSETQNFTADKINIFKSLRNI